MLWHEAGDRAEGFGDGAAVALGVVALKAQQGDGPAELAGERGQQRLLRAQVAPEIPKEPRIVAIVAQLVPNALRRTQRGLVAVVDAGAVQALAQRGLGEALAARHGDLADIEQQGDVEFLQGAQEIGRVGALIADGEHLLEAHGLAPWRARSAVRKVSIRPISCCLARGARTSI